MDWSRKSGPLTSLLGSSRTKFYTLVSMDFSQIMIFHFLPISAGPHSLDSFCQALLLHLQNFGSGSSISSATSLLNQVRESSACSHWCLLLPQVAGGEEDPLLRQQVQLANQLSLLQQLSSQSVGQPSATGGDAKSTASSSEAATGAAVTTTSQVRPVFW